MKNLKVIIINIVIFICFLFTIEFISFLFVKSWDFQNSYRTQKFGRKNSEQYNNKIDHMKLSMLSNTFRDHHDFKSLNFNTENGFRGNQSFGKVNVKNRAIFFEEKKLLDNILIFGGSTTFGSTVKDHHTFPEKLNKKLKNQYNIINLGLGGSVFENQVEIFYNTQKNNQISKKIVFLFGVNEFTSCKKLIETSQNDYSLKIIRNNYFTLIAIDYLLHIFDLKQQKEKKISQKSLIKKDAFNIKKCSEYYQKQLKFFDLFLKNSNYPEAYVIFQPLNHTSNSADEWVKKYAQKETRDAYIEFISALKLKYYIVQTVDFSFIFNDIEEKFFNDTQHYNENGNTVLANNFFKFLYD